MVMRKLKGFTLIELLIVVAIIAILAAIAIPNFLEAQVRARVARVKSDMRSMATAIEAYSIDMNLYPASLKGSRSVNFGLPQGNARYRLTFANGQAANITEAPNPGGRFFALTTPQAYIGAIAADTFADEKAAALGYASAEDKGWIMWSYGPDADENTGGGGSADVSNGGGQVGPLLEVSQSGGGMISTGKAAGALPISFWGSVFDSVYAGNGLLLTAPGTNGTSGIPQQIGGNSIMNLYLNAPGNGTGVFCYDPSNGTSSTGDIISVQGTGPIN